MDYRLPDDDFDRSADLIAIAMHRSEPVDAAHLIYCFAELNMSRVILTHEPHLDTTRANRQLCVNNTLCLCEGGRKRLLAENPMAGLQ
jgi:hypothetical protein